MVWHFQLPCKLLPRENGNGAHIYGISHMLLLWQNMRNPINFSYTVHKFWNIPSYHVFIPIWHMLSTLKILCVHEVYWTKSSLWGLVREKRFVFCFCSVLSHEELSPDHLSHVKWTLFRHTCYIKGYVNGTHVTWKVMSLDCHMKSYITGTLVTCSYVTGTLVTWKVMSLEHLPHAKLCHWNTCHMQSYVTGTLVTWKVVTGTLVTWKVVTGTLVTCKVMSLEHLSHAKLCHWNTCHMKSSVTGILVTWKVMSLEHFSQAHLFHEGLCHWNISHMQSYVTGTLVTCRVMSMEHLSHEQLHHWNICHIYTFSKGNNWFKNAVQLATLKSSAQYHMTPPQLARKQMTAAAKMLFCLVFTQALKKIIKNTEPRNRCISNMQYNCIPTFKHV